MSSINMSQNIIPRSDLVANTGTIQNQTPLSKKRRTLSNDNKQKLDKVLCEIQALRDEFRAQGKFSFLFVQSMTFTDSESEWR